jgi:hypothetical protein
MIDVALYDGVLIETNQNIVEDFREFVQIIVRLAMEFDINKEKRRTRLHSFYRSIFRGEIESLLYD